MTPLFFYGTLCDRLLLNCVLGHDGAQGCAAEISDHAVFWVQGQGFPIIQPKAGRSAKGLLCENLSDQDVARLQYYEAGFDYHTKVLPVRVGEKSIQAKVFFPLPGAWAPGADWNLADWQQKYGPAVRDVAAQIMTDYRPDAPPVPPKRQSVLGQRAQARLAAGQDPTPSRAGTPGVENIKIHSKTMPYDSFFAVQEVCINVPRFAGGTAADVDRAVFVSADAVSVLPYDPVTDRVLLIEQFRTAPFVRGDTNPWQLEPVAGRVDEGETYLEAARREMVEETGKTAAQLIEIGRYYTSPGSLVEFMVSYIGLTDLPSEGSWMGGLVSEDEDICSHVIGYDTMLDWQAQGYLRNGPLLISTGWLALNRARLRRASRIGDAGPL